MMQSIVQGPKPIEWMSSLLSWIQESFWAQDGLDAAHALAIRLLNRPEYQDQS